MNSLLATLSRERVPVSALESLYLQSGAQPGWVDGAIRALGQLDPEVAYRAVWLLRKAAAVAPLGDRDLGRVAELVDGSGHWIYRLTMCQLWAETGCPPALRDQVFPFLRRCFADRRVIVRAWALTAMMRFGDDSGFGREIRQCGRVARRDPAKSMQARLRRVGLAGGGGSDPRMGSRREGQPSPSRRLAKAKGAEVGTD